MDLPRKIIVRELNYEKRTVVAVKVADESGTCDITFWDAISAQAAQLYIGQTVLIGGLATIIKDGIVYVNAGYEQGSYMYVINTLSGLLSSLPLRDTSFISEIFEKESGFISGYIRDIRPSTLHKTINSSDSRRFDYKCGNFLINTHKFCMNPVERNQETQTKNLYKCPKCPSDEDQITTKDTSYQFNIELKVEDGSSCVWMRCNPHAANVTLFIYTFLVAIATTVLILSHYPDMYMCEIYLVLPSNRYKFGNKMQLNGMNNEACVPFRIEAAMPTIC
ncbi:hypothetical protein AX774_g5429 [Zancudomyces culisetae]|uniref:Cell division control protein 24 OB domain-containing protein n=1 Tax=Zancudomyces culisetae TaxID=1213189 RepID=A0A1R1PJJ9_ZANCU|nr:hypothetical protein AX774_g5429 [Zancudomyces culisetae]|eukprot:OMH81117.1 hypothetical protein AX774_g5429 [Zancudomyces culisetae]